MVLQYLVNLTNAWKYSYTGFTTIFCVKTNV
jgi:hypothetical protein